MSCPVHATGRRGFTLVELLVVIIIVGLLAGMITAGVAAAMRRAKRAQISLEISQLSLAMRRYKEQAGQYPPDFALDPGTGVDPNNPNSPPLYGDVVVRRHFRKACPRYQGDPYQDLPALISLDPAEALVFWLGGLPSSQLVPAGFCKIPARPLEPPSQNASRTLPLFEFDETRLADVDNDGWPEYYPPGFVPGQDPPYVYFAALPIWYNHPDSRLRYHPNAAYPPPNHPMLGGSWGRAQPYAASPSPGQNTFTWMEPRGFQILCAGLDRSFGTPQGVRFFPTGTNYAEEDWDNLVSFYEGTLEDASQDATLNP